MEIEFHRLDLRYEALRTRDAKRERQVLASLSEVGQLLPVIVVRESSAGGYVLVDGYKRVRALRRLHADAVSATEWMLGEVEALLLDRLMRHERSESPLEQGWLLRELTDRFGLSQAELARRFDRTVSWVSRRLALVSELPPSIQAHVRSGAIAAHAAMKYLAPLARAKREECVRLADSIAGAKLSTRQVGELYAAWTSGNERTRERLLSDPLLYLRVERENRRPDEPAKSPAAALLADMEILGSVARRADRRLRDGWFGRVPVPERQEIGGALAQATADLQTLEARWKKEVEDARRGDEGRDPRAA